MLNCYIEKIKIQNKYYSLFSQAVSMGWGLFVLVIAVKCVGVDGYGKLVKILGASIPLQLITQYGFTIFGSIMVAKVNQKKLVPYYTNATVLRVLVGLVGSVLLYYPLRLYINDLSVIEIFVGVTIGVVSGLDSTWFYNGLEDFRSVFFINIGSKAIGGVIIFGLIMANCIDSMSLAIAYLISFALLFSVQSIRFCKIDSFDLREMADIEKKMRSNFLTSLSISGYTILPTTLLSGATTAYIMGIYGIGERIYSLITTIKESLGSVDLVRYAKGGTEGVRSYVKTTLLTVCLSYFMILVAFYVVENHYVIANYAQIELLLLYVSIRVICAITSSFASALGIYKIARGKLNPLHNLTASILGGAAFCVTTLFLSKPIPMVEIPFVFLFSEFIVLIYLFMIHKITSSPNNA